MHNNIYFYAFGDRNFSANFGKIAFANTRKRVIIIVPLIRWDNYMKSVLEELMGYIADHHDTLIAQLNEKQKEIFEKFDDCWDELTDINEREIFVYAFKLGMRIAIEVLSSNTD